MLAFGGRARVPHPCGTPSAQRLLDPCARPAQPPPAAGPEGNSSKNRATRSLLICVSSAHCEGSPDGLPTHASHRETPCGRRYSVPVPAGAKTGSLCARMCARRCRPQPRHGPGVIADSGRFLRRPGLPISPRVVSSFLSSRRPCCLRRLSPAHQRPGPLKCTGPYEQENRHESPTLRYAA